jgi:exosortase
MSARLNARIGRALPSPLIELLNDAATTTPRPRAFGMAGRPWAAVPREIWLASALLAALWPHWHYIARRTVDGSDDPWGILALLTVIGLVLRDRRYLAVPSTTALMASAALALLAAGASLFLPDLAAAALAMLALAVFVVHALPGRPATPLVALLMLTLPLIASLHFYLGYPLRVFAANAASALLTALGVPAQAAGAAIVHDDLTVLIDAPCAGIGMLWVGSYTAALLSYCQRASWRTTAINAAVACALVLVANVLRNTVLFFPEAGLVTWPAWSHEAVGLLAFACAIVPLALFILRRSA